MSNVLALHGRESFVERIARHTKMTKRVRELRNDLPWWRFKMRRDLQADLDDAMAKLEAEVHGG